MRSATCRAGLFLGLIAGLAGAPVLAAAPAPPAPPTTQPVGDQQLQAAVAPVPPEVQKLRHEFGKQMIAGQYDDALKTLDDLAKLSTNDGQITYNRARCLASLGRTAEALDTLDKAIDQGGADPDRMGGDRYLQSLHSNPRFATLLTKAKKHEDDAYARFPYQADTTKIPGVKTIEANPPGALRYRILMDPAATAANPDRLLVWLHPAGASMNATLEAMAPDLIAHHVALMVFTQKDFSSWSGTDESRLLTSLQDAATVPGIDPQSKPLGLGLSAGGQMLMRIYTQDPEIFAGVAFDAAYPVDLSVQPPKLLEQPPADPSVQNEPILAIFGGKDSLADIWPKVADAWRKAGVPLKVAEIPGRGHAWLFDNSDRRKLLLDWIDDVVAAQVAAGGNAGGAATQPAEAAPENPPQASNIQETLKQLYQQMQSKDWANALITAEQLDKAAPNNADVVYNKACILARLGKKKEALDTLDRAIDDGFVDADHIKSDDDMASLHDDPQFQTLVDKAAKVADDYSKFPYEQGANIPAVRTIEHNPPGGLRYRVRMSKTATAEHPDRLVIWFHPSGGSMDNVVEALSPELAKHHLALVVFTQKDYRNWDAKDIARLTRSLASIGKIRGISAKKAIGLGFSAGGQMMLQIYDSDPAQFAGMVLDAAYPVTIQPGGQVTMQADPPNNPDVKKTPLLVFVGGDDGGSQVWTTVEDNWRAKGVPLDLNIIPNRKHEWLIDTAERQTKLIDWLTAVAAGQLPGAPSTQPTTQPLAEQLTPQEKEAKAQGQYALLRQQMQNLQWADALTTADELIKLAPKSADIAYNRACVLARLGKTKDALAELARSIDDGFDDFDHMKVDDDLQSLHTDPQFATLVEKAKKVGNDYTRFPYEKGDDIPEVKTIEGSAGPDGLRYRIRMSKTATAEHPDRLVVWFHPSGGSMDNIVEALSPDLAKHHLALLVFPQKDYLGWSPTDVDHVNKTLEAIAKIPSINSKQPLAIGFSAGGQMLLQLYNNNPSEFGGMVLDSAYPIIMTDATHGKVLTPPANPAVKTTPILAVVGDADQNAKIWTAAEPAWRSAGVPLTLDIVPNGVHQWLFNSPEQQKLLIDWLAEVDAGKLPGAPTTNPATEPATQPAGG